jgi:hypothetical protein
VIERFYSGDRDGTLTARDGDGPRRPIHSCFDYQVHMAERARLAPRARLAFDLLADALDNRVPSGEVLNYFLRRVVPLLPDRFTISRSRVRDYVEQMTVEERAENKN